MLPHWKASSVTVDGSPFHYTRTGNGDKPALVLLHGFSDNGLCWTQAARDLEGDYDVIMPDARGHGLSARVQPGEVVDAAADAAGLIEALGLHRPVVVGHSMGGVTAASLAARWPERVGALVLEDPAWFEAAPQPDPPGPHPFAEWLLHLEAVSMDEIMARGRKDNPTWQEIELPAWAQSKKQFDTNFFYARTLSQPWREAAAGIRCPALLLRPEGEGFIIVTPQVAAEALGLVPTLRVAVIPKAGHSIRRENFPAYMQAVKGFLGSL